MQVKIEKKDKRRVPFRSYPGKSRRNKGGGTSEARRGELSWNEFSLVKLRTRLCWCCKYETTRSHAMHRCTRMMSFVMLEGLHLGIIEEVRVGYARALDGGTDGSWAGLEHEAGGDH